MSFNVKSDSTSSTSTYPMKHWLLQLRLHFSLKRFLDWIHRLRQYWIPHRLLHLFRLLWLVTTFAPIAGKVDFPYSKNWHKFWIKRIFERDNKNVWKVCLCFSYFYFYIYLFNHLSLFFEILLVNYLVNFYFFEIIFRTHREISRNI